MSRSSFMGTAIKRRKDEADQAFVEKLRREHEEFEFDLRTDESLPHILSNQSASVYEMKAPRQAK